MAKPRQAVDSTDPAGTYIPRHARRSEFYQSFARKYRAWCVRRELPHGREAYGRLKVGKALHSDEAG